MTLGRKIISIVATLTFLLGMALTSVPVYAAQTCSIAIIPVTVEDNTTIIKGHAFELYQIASVDHGVYKLTNDFKDLEANLNLDSSSDLASSVTKFLQNHNVNGAVKTADSSGVVAFKELSIGLYYIAQCNTVTGYDQVVPFMVTLPYKAPDGSGYTYNVKAYPKVEPSEMQPGESDDPDGIDTPGTSDQPGDNNTSGDKPEDNNAPVDDNASGGGTNGDNTGGSSIGNASNGGGAGGNSSNGGTSSEVDNSNPITNAVETVQEILAKTGALMWPIIILGCLGLILIVVGVFILKWQKGRTQKEMRRT